MLLPLLSRKRTFADEIRKTSSLIRDNASVAVGLRKVNLDYIGYCLRVRRSIDDAETDIGWNGLGVDEDTLLSFCGAGSGYVTTLYNQVTGNNATQSVSGSQPRIVDNGVIEKDSKGNIGWRGLSSFDTSLTASLSPAVPAFQAFGVGELPSESIVDFAHVYSGTESGIRMRADSRAGINTFGVINGVHNTSVSFDFTATFQFSIYASSNRQVVSVNRGTPLIGSDSYTGLTNDTLMIGDDSTGSNVWRGKQSELILFPSELSTNNARLIKETQIKAYKIS